MTAEYKAYFKCQQLFTEMISSQTSLLLCAQELEQIALDYQIEVSERNGPSNKWPEWVGR